MSTSQITSSQLDSDRGGNALVNSSGKKVIDMDLIDKIKNMRSKSREINNAFSNPTAAT